jgi:hypothetical protein
VSGGDGARGYLVECYWPAVTEQAVADAAHRAVQAAAEIRRQGQDVEFLTAILVPAEETTFLPLRRPRGSHTNGRRQSWIPVQRVLESVRADRNPCQTQLQALINSVTAGCPLHLYKHD